MLIVEVGAKPGHFPRGIFVGDLRVQEIARLQPIAERTVFEQRTPLRTDVAVVHTRCERALR